MGLGPFLTIPYLSRWIKIFNFRFLEFNFRYKDWSFTKNCVLLTAPYITTYTNVKREKGCGTLLCCPAPSCIKNAKIYWLLCGGKKMALFLQHIFSPLLLFVTYTCSLYWHGTLENRILREVPIFDSNKLQSIQAI